MLPANENLRKIIHVDMDCFYAAIEIRDNPSLKDKPIAVGGEPGSRGVLCTSNYIARQYGVRSAMPTSTALRLCKDLVVLPVNMTKYKEVAKNIHAIFHEYSELVEPLSLDEAYIDVTDSKYCKGSATLIAQEIRHKIYVSENLTASAGIAPNKFLAKIASGWNKPNGIFVITPKEINNFIKLLPVEKIFGVGKVTAEKLHQLGLKTCEDIQNTELEELIKNFGKFGQQLYSQSFGIDSRPVIANRERKSLSVEHTFSDDIKNKDICLAYLKNLYDELLERLKNCPVSKPIKNQFVKIKFNNFHLVSSEISVQEICFEKFHSLFENLARKTELPIRLIGIGVHFWSNEKSIPLQQEFIF